MPANVRIIHPKYNLYAVCASSLLLSTVALSAQTAETKKTNEPAASSIVGFQDIWKLLREASPERTAAELETESQKAAADRFARHFLPRIYVQGQAFRTNDPALNFMSTLEQRKLSTTDMSVGFSSRELTLNPSLLSNAPALEQALLRPDTLNQPGSRAYKHGTIGLDLPLYEGGASSALAQIQDKLFQGRKIQERLQLQDLYTHTAGHYAALLSASKQKRQLSQLKELVGFTLARYQIGAGDNPLGYSGLLGLRTLNNRLQGMINDSETRLDTIKRTISIYAQSLPADWTVKDEDPISFLDYALTVEEEKQESASEGLLRIYIDAAKAQTQAETARFLPRFGVFTSADLTAGDRGSATSTNAGFYLQMNLLSPTDIGSVKQTELAEKALQARAAALRQKNQAERSSATAALSSIKQNLKLLQESLALLEEQNRTAQRLFQNGMINVMQYIEVLSRRADVLANIQQAEEEYARAKINLFILNNSNIPGVGDEKRAN